MYLTSVNVTVLKDLLQMVQGNTKTSIEYVKLCRIYLDEEESFRKLLKVLRKAAIPGDVNISLNVDLRSLRDVSEVTISGLIKLVSGDRNKMKRVKLNLWLSENVGHTLQGGVERCGVEPVLKNFKLTLFDDEMDPVKRIEYVRDKGVKYE